MKNKIAGELWAPSSKSVLQRAIIMAYLSEEETLLKNVVFCEDASNALQIVKNLGAKISYEETNLVINFSNKAQDYKEIFVGESGLLTRIIVPALALKGKNFIIQGQGSLLKRPLDFQVLQDLGVKYNSSNSYLPLEFSGKLMVELVFGRLNFFTTFKRTFAFSSQSRKRFLYKGEKFKKFTLC